MTIVTNDAIIENYFDSFKLLYYQFLKDASNYGPFREKHYNVVEQLTYNNVIMMLSVNKPIGFVSYNFQDDDELFISSLYVDPSMRHKGVATELIKRIPNELKHKIVYCYSDNINALEFYKKIGFKEYFKGLYLSK